MVFTHRPLFNLFSDWDWWTRDGSKAIDLLKPYKNVIVFYGHIHQENHHNTRHIAHHSAKSLIYLLPAPGSLPQRVRLPFLQDYWNGRIKVIGTMGFYTKPYLMSIGGLKKLTNMPIAIFSEYLLIMQISLLKKVIIIDAPLVYYRAHEGSWSESNKDHESSEIAGINFLKMSIEIFKSPLAD